MKSRCSFILKAGLSLVLCFVLLFGTMSTGLAAHVDIAASGYTATKDKILYVYDQYHVIDRNDCNYMYIGYRYASSVVPQRINRVGNSYLFAMSVDQTRDNLNQKFMIFFTNSDWGSGTVDSQGSDNWNTIANNDDVHYMAVDGSGDIQNNRLVTLAAYPDSGKQAADLSPTASNVNIDSRYVNGFSVTLQKHHNDDYTSSSSVGSVNIATSYWNTNRNGGGTSNLDVTSTGSYDNSAITAPVTLTATPATGYHFENFLVDGNNHGNQKSSTDNPYTFTNDLWAENEHPIYARFVPNTHTVTFDQQSGSGGSASVTATYDDSMPSITLPSRTNYDFQGYYTSTSGGGTKYYNADGSSAKTFDVDDDTLVLYAYWTLKKTTVTLNKSGGEGGTDSFTATYSESNNIPSFSAPERTGYVFDGYYASAGSVGTKYFNADGTAATAWDQGTNTATVYAGWDEVKVGVGTNVFTNGEDSDVGGSVAVVPSTVGVETKGTFTASPSANYTLLGWNKSGVKSGSITLYADAACQTPYVLGTHGANGNVVYVKTNGDDDITTGNAVVEAYFGSSSRTYTVGAMLKLNTGAYSVANVTSERAWTETEKEKGTFTTTTTVDSSSSSTVAINSTFTLATTDDIRGQDLWNEALSEAPDNNNYTKYDFLGWYPSKTAKTTITDEELAAAIAGGILIYDASPSAITNDGYDPYAYYYAVYVKNYIFCAYRSYDNVEGAKGHIVYKAAPPMHISVAGGAEEDYIQGHKYAVPAGSSAMLSYSALASSDMILDVNYCNDIDYTRATPTAENFTSTPPSIAPANLVIDNKTHNVMLTFNQDYRNVTLVLKDKYQFIFVDDTSAVDIISEVVDNYYADGETISAAEGTDNQFMITAKTDDTRTIAFDPEDVQFFSDAACENEITSGISIGDRTRVVTVYYGTGEDDHRDDTYYVITGTMPDSNVYVKLNVSVHYNCYLGSKMLSDRIVSKDSFGDIGTYGLYDGATQQLTGGSDPASITSAYPINDGTTVTLKYAYTGDNANWYTFVGWYWGDSSGPDYTNGYIGNKKVQNYTPKKHTYFYAVCTRDLYINGAAGITGADAAWNSVGGTETNFLMTFDPTLGTIGKYYWDIPESGFAKVSQDYDTPSSLYSSGGGGGYYWNNNSSVGNAFFQFRDEATGANKSLWKNVASFVTDATDVKYGKIYEKKNGDNDQSEHGLGFIDFSLSKKNGYNIPLRILYDPATQTFTVEATGIYPHIYVSNGFKGIDTGSDEATNTYHDGYDILKDVNVEPVYGGGVVSEGEEGYFTITANGNGWTPYTKSGDVYTRKYEGHVNDFKIEKQNATVRLTKTVSSSSYKVSTFVIYNIKTDKITTVDAKKVEGQNKYYADITTKNDEGLYIVPIIEDANADMTVVFDASQLDYNEWGDFVSCYAWYSDGTNYAYGTYPGQMMVPSANLDSWTAKFPSKCGDATIAGITFGNYYESTQTWLGNTNVLTAAAGSTVIIPRAYNTIGTGDFVMSNCKVQTYDYREPISFFINENTEDASVKPTITFAIKRGNTEFITYTHDDLEDDVNAVLRQKPGQRWPISFEMLTNASGDKYTDFNGVELDSKPAPTYYVVAKGEVAYKNIDGETGSRLERVFWSKNFYQTPTASVGSGDGYENKGAYSSGTAVVYPKDNVDMNNAVEWYIYDASGEYITTVLSAAYADQVIDGFNSADTTRLVVQALSDKGFAVDGKAVAISYDTPRYCYTKGGDPEVDNGGSSFDCYRFTGQWYKTVQTENKTVSVKVGMLTDNGAIVADSNTMPYGNATIGIDYSLGSPNYASSSTSNSITMALLDANKGLVKLDATSTNFKGWYYYGEDGKLNKAAYDKPAGFYTKYSKDTEYLALYSASAIYQYEYQGREGSVVYSVSGSVLDEDEMLDYKLKMTRVLSGTKPGSDVITVFGKTVDFTDAEAYDNNTDYVLKINHVSVSPASYTLTYTYPDAEGVDRPHTITGPINTKVDITIAESGAVTAHAPAGQVFKGWYDYTGGVIGELLSTQPNFGYSITRDQAIIAQYGTPHVYEGDTWTAHIEYNTITHEMYTDSTGLFYNDSILRITNSGGMSVPLPADSEVGVIIINDGKTNKTINRMSENTLKNYANLLSHAQTGKIGSTGCTATKLCTDSVSSFNRVDLALRTDYAASSSSRYAVYAYVKIGNTYYFNTTAATGSY